MRLVLNARRHRRGNQAIEAGITIGCRKCSTPEGIGGGISNNNNIQAAIEAGCSTPEGIGGGIRRTRTGR